MCVPQKLKSWYRGMDQRNNYRNHLSLLENKNTVCIFSSNQSIEAIALSNHLNTIKGDSAMQQHMHHRQIRKRPTLGRGYCEHCDVDQDRHRRPHRDQHDHLHYQEHYSTNLQCCTWLEYLTPGYTWGFPKKGLPLVIIHLFIGCSMKRSSDKGVPPFPGPSAKANRAMLTCCSLSCQEHCGSQRIPCQR